MFTPLLRSLEVLRRQKRESMLAVQQLTTTYHGFQCVMDEATSEKFRGDKYENGVITPRPPPVQYGRGRYNDRNRNYDQRRPRQYGDRNMNYNQQGSAPQDGRGLGPPPQDGRSFGPPPQDGRGYGLPQQDRRGYGLPQQDGRGYAPPQQDGRGYALPQQDGTGYGPLQQDGMGYGQGQRNFSQGQGGTRRKL